MTPQQPTPLTLNTKFYSFPANELKAILECIDTLGLALAEHEHHWTTAERKTYERAIRLINAQTLDTDE